MFTISQWVKRITMGALSLTLLPLVGVVAAAPAVAAPFREYYTQHQGMRVLGNPLTDLQTVDGHPAQYFEKGRIEEHRAEANPHWRFMYGRLGAQLIADGNAAPVGGDTSSYTYATLAPLADPSQLEPTPYPGVDGAVDSNPRLGIFIPVNPQLKSGPGHFVLPQFWRYMNRRDLFPSGWLHDIGLPLTEPVNAEVTKAGKQRGIIIQAFERTILTFDPQNPSNWQVERANVGTDLLRGTRQLPSQATPEAVRGQVALFLHNVTVDPRAAEMGWVDFLSKNARQRYVGNRAVEGSAWINKILGIQNTIPDCLMGDGACMTSTDPSLWTVNRGMVTAAWRYNSAKTAPAESNRVFQLVIEDGSWKIDDVSGVDYAETDGRYQARYAVGQLFTALRNGPADQAALFLTDKLRATVNTDAQIKAWLGIKAAPRMVDVQLQTPLAENPLVKAGLRFDDGSYAEHRFELNNVVRNDYQIDGVLP